MMRFSPHNLSPHFHFELAPFVFPPRFSAISAVKSPSADWHRLDAMSFCAPRRKARQGDKATVSLYVSEGVVRVPVA